MQHRLPRCSCTNFSGKFVWCLQANGCTYLKFGHDIVVKYKACTTRSKRVKTTGIEEAWTKLGELCISTGYLDTLKWRVEILRNVLHDSQHDTKVTIICTCFFYKMSYTLASYNKTTFHDISFSNKIYVWKYLNENHYCPYWAQLP